MHDESSGLQKPRGGGIFAQFRTKLLLLVLLLVVPAFGLVLFSSFQQQRVEKEKARESAVAISRLAAAQQQQFIRNARQMLATLTGFSFLTLTTNTTFAEMNLANLIKLSPDYLTFGLIELDGTVFASASRTNHSASLADRSYFKRVLSTKVFTVGDYQVGRLSGQPSLNFGYPVLDRGELKRVVFAALKLSLLSESIAAVPMPSDAVITVVDRSGNILARHPGATNWVGESIASTSIFKWAAEHKQGIVELPGVDGVPRLHAITCIAEDGLPSLFISVGIPVETSFAHANQQLIRNCLLLAAFTIALLIAAWLYARQYFLRPVSALVDAANRIALGNLTARINLTGGATELSVLGNAFDSMAGRLEEREKEIKRAHGEIAEANATLERKVQERTTELAVLNQELEAFSYSVSHDLRAPLRHIGGFVNLLHKNGNHLLDAKCQRYVSMIAESASDMGKLVDDLLSFSRMGRTAMRNTEIHLEPLVQGVISEMEPETKDRDINWKISPLPSVKGDAALLKQVIINLISNALKYSRTRSPAVIEIGCPPSENDEHVCFVRDNGVGFDMKYADKLFGVFQRLHSSDEFEGTGIGLANVQRIIGRHGGRTWAESEVDRGATFYFALPKSSHTKT